MTDKEYKKSHVTAEEKAEFLSIVAKNGYQKEFAEKLRITSKTITNWKKKGIPFSAYLIAKQEEGIKKLLQENLELREKLDKVKKVTDE